MFLTGKKLQISTPHFVLGIAAGRVGGEPIQELTGRGAPAIDSKN
jgi:hypothetical protein